MRFGFNKSETRTKHSVRTCKIVAYSPLAPTPTDGRGVSVNLAAPSAATARLAAAVMSPGCFPPSASDDSTPSLSKDISSALSTVPECFDSEGGFPLEDELRIEPLSLDGLSMLSDPDMVLPDPSVEDTFRSDRL